MPVTRKRASGSEPDDVGKHDKIASTSAVSTAKKRASESAPKKRKPSEKAVEHELDAQPRRRDASASIDILDDDADDDAESKGSASNNDTSKAASSFSVPSRSLSGAPPRLGRRAMAESSTPHDSLLPRTRAAPRLRLLEPLTVTPTPVVPSSRKSVAAEVDIKATTRTANRSAAEHPVAPAAGGQDVKVPLASEAGRTILHTLQDGHAPSRLENSAQDTVPPPLPTSEPTSKMPSASNKGPFTNASAPRAQDASTHSVNAPAILKPVGLPGGTASGSKGSQLAAPSSIAKQGKKASERKYVCDEPRCGRAFLRGEHLKRHKASLHSIEKSHKCPHEGCRRAFSRHDNLRQHFRTHVPKDHRVGAMMPAYYMTDDLPPVAGPSTFGHPGPSPDAVPIPTAAMGSVSNASSSSDSSRSVSLEASEVLTEDPQQDEEFLAAYFPSAALSPFSSYRPAFSRPTLTSPNKKSSAVGVAAAALPSLAPSGPAVLLRKDAKLPVAKDTAAAAVGAEAAAGQSYEGVYDSDSGSEVSMGA